MKTIGHEDLGCPVVAGQYPFNTILVDVGAAQAREWERDPHVRFALVHSYDNRYSMVPLTTSSTLVL